MQVSLDHSVSLGARLYVFLIVLFGTPTIGYCLYQSWVRHEPSWLFLAALTTLGSAFPITIPTLDRDRETMTGTVNDVFLFSGLLMYGTEVAATLAALEGFIAGWRGRITSPYKLLFNACVLSMAMLVSGEGFFRLIGKQPPLGPGEIENLALFVLLFILSAVTFFLINSGAVALAISMTARRPFLVLWKQDFLWASLTTVAGSSVAALVFLSSEGIELLSMALASPIILVVYYAYKLNVNRVREAHAHANQLHDLYHSTIASLAMAIDAKDQCTHGHVQRVQALALGLARRCGFNDPKDLQGLKAAALLHDIGKLAVPEYILNKPSGLTEWEVQKMRAHPSVGAEILETVPFPYPVTPYVRSHHEKWDGTGYPDGLAGEEIPLGARILSLADCYDALRSNRPYRSRLSRIATIDYVRTQAGKAYDPKLVDVLIDNIDELETEIEAAEQQLPRSVMRKIEASLGSGRIGKRDIARTVFHDIASAHREIQAVYEISQTVGKSLNVSETLALLASKIRNLAPYDACAVYLLNSQTEMMSPYQVVGDYADALEEIELKVGDGVTVWVAANRQTLINVSPGPDFTDNPFLQNVFQSCLCLPLSIEDSILGVISLYSTRPNTYDDDHLRLMETITPQAASAINNAIIYEETQEDAYTDLLTGLPNLRYFKVFGEQELKRAARVNYPVTFLMMDLESFKSINDRYGHKVGDRALIEISHILRNQMRRSDTCIRYGGDEFVGILPGVDKALVQRTMSRIQEAVDQHRIILNEKESVSLGISLGAATFPVDGRDLEVLLAIADHAMYRNKIQRSRSLMSPNVLPFDKREQG